VTLQEFVSSVRQAVFADLVANLPPSVGVYDDQLLAEARVQNPPQLGSVRYEPTRVVLEYIYSAPGRKTIVLPVHVEAPERIVFLPVPGWVLETIWQGDVDGSYHFESEAQALVADFVAELEPEANAKWFGPRPPKRRE